MYICNMEKIDKGRLWDLLVSYLLECNMSIGGELEDLKDGLYEDFKMAQKAIPALTVRDFLEAFVDELLCYPIQISDKVIAPNGQ